MSNAIEKYQPSTLEDIQRVAQMMMVSGYWSKGGGNEAVAKIAVSIMAGQEMGYGPFASVNGIHVVEGKPTVSANLMAAAVKAHPHYDYRIKNASNDLVEIEFFQGRESLGVESFSIKDAQIAGLTNKPNWKKYPRDMLFARCISRGVRSRCPDVFSGNAVYTPDEFDLTVDVDGDVVEVEAQPLPESLDDVDAVEVEPEVEWCQMVAIECRNTFADLGDQDEARHWYVGVWTEKNTDIARTSSKDLQPDECERIVKTLRNHRKVIREQYSKHLDATVIDEASE